MTRWVFALLLLITGEALLARTATSTEGGELQRAMAPIAAVLK